ncbi:hypothetical protein FACS1894125_0020 [Actinomycetota bacterium]|nr:hypothetical protein FACS1894125_0020 [Actinomycetota bacterium]
MLITSLDRGGIETAVVNYCRQLDSQLHKSTRLGVDVQIDFLVNRQQIGAYEPELTDLGCKIYRMGAMYPWRFNAYKFEFSQFLKKHPDYDIIHSHLEERSFFPLQVAQRIRYTAQLIAQSHSAHNLPWTQPKSYFRRYFRRGLQKLQGITRVAVSDLSARWLFGTSEGITILPNPIRPDGLEFSKNIRKSIRNQLGIAQDALVLGNIGRLTYQKNHKMVLEVWTNIREAYLLLVGKGNLRSSIVKVAEKLGISERLHIIESTPTPSDYLHAMDVFIFPSHFEGLPLAAIEAQANGLPVLASDAVPREVDLSGDVQFLPISGPSAVDLWTSHIQLISSTKLAQREVRSRATLKQLKTSNYSSPKATEHLLKLYGLT